MKVLVVDDDETVVESIRTVLRLEGHEVLTRDSASGCLAAVRSWRPDLVLLDIMMPGGMTGLDALRILRRETDLPVILITAHGSDAYKVLGLEYADDYLVKPFSMPELLSRIGAVMRRVRPRADRVPVLEVGDLRIDPGTREVHVAGRLVTLTPKEFDLLLALASRAGQVVPREDLVARVWGEDAYVDPRTLAVHVGTLRRKLEAGQDGRRTIVTVRAIGYRLLA